MNLKNKLSQKATYWESNVGNGFGFSTWKAPVVLDVRWQDVQKLIKDKHGEEKVSDATVWTETDIDINGRLLLGVHANATPPETAREPQAKVGMVGVWGSLIGYKVML